MTSLVHFSIGNDTTDPVSFSCDGMPCINTISIDYRFYYNGIVYSIAISPGSYDDRFDMYPESIRVNSNQKYYMELHQRYIGQGNYRYSFREILLAQST